MGFIVAIGAKKPKDEGDGEEYGSAKKKSPFGGGDESTDENATGMRKSALKDLAKALGADPAKVDLEAMDSAMQAYQEACSESD